MNSVSDWKNREFWRTFLNSSFMSSIYCKELRVFSEKAPLTNCSVSFGNKHIPSPKLRVKDLIILWNKFETFVPTLNRIIAITLYVVLSAVS